MAAHDNFAKKTPQKPRVKKAVAYDHATVEAAMAKEEIRRKKPFYLRAIWVVPALAVFIAAIPFLRAALNLLRPDIDPPTQPAKECPGLLQNDATLEKFLAKLKDLRLKHPEFNDDIVHGFHYDENLTPAFLTEVGSDLESAFKALDTDAPTGKINAIAAMDGALLAELASHRARTLSPECAGQQRSAHIKRLALAECRLASAGTPKAFDEALDHKLSVLDEILNDRQRLQPGIAGDPSLIKTLASKAAPLKATAQVAIRFDQSLETAPDAALMLMIARNTPEGSLAPEDTFEAFARFGRRKNAHREKIIRLHHRFGNALAAPTHAEALKALSVIHHPGETRRMASMLLRDRTLARLGTDPALDYYYPEVARPPRDFDRVLLEFAAIAGADDIYGETLLLHRRATLLKLVARYNRVRFQTAAVAYAIAFDFRRALAGGKWPKTTEGLFDGLLEAYPADPFTDEPVAFARKGFRLISPGADGVARGGLDEPEFATDLMQLWEPTLALDPDPGPSPAAFGLKISDLEKPLPRPWEAPAKEIPAPLGDTDSKAPAATK